MSQTDAASTKKDDATSSARTPSTSEPGAKSTRGRRFWIPDLIAGFSVALVLVPQGMAYAELAGLPAHHGLYASALPLIFAAIYASSPYIQTGPTALTSLLAFGALATIATPGSGEYIALAALLALVVGLVRTLIGALQAGVISYLLSQPVMRGFTAAAGLLILCSQLPAALGVATQLDGGVLSRALAAVTDPGLWEPAALGLTALTLILMLGGRRVHALFPGVLVAVVCGVVLSLVFEYQGPVLGEIPQAVLPPLSLDLPWHRIGDVLLGGTVIAVVGFAEVAAIAQTYSERSGKPWNPNREFLSQGVANITAGLAAGFPVGGSFSRSALNRLAGAKTRAAGAITGLTVLLFLPLSDLLTTLPRAILGAIVVGAVFGLLKPGPLILLWRQSPAQALIGYSTFVLTLYFAPHIEYAVIAGIAISVAVHAWREQAVEVAANMCGHTLTLTPSGVVWFASATKLRQAMAREIAGQPEVARLVVDLHAVGRIDLTGVLALRQLFESVTVTNIAIVRVPPHAKRLVARILADYVDDL